MVVEDKCCGELPACMTAPRQARSCAVQIADLMPFSATAAKTGNTTLPAMLYEMIGVVRDTPSDTLLRSKY